VGLRNRRQQGWLAGVRPGTGLSGSLEERFARWRQKAWMASDPLRYTRFGPGIMQGITQSQRSPRNNQLGDKRGVIPRQSCDLSAQVAAMTRSFAAYWT